MSNCISCGMLLEEKSTSILASNYCIYCQDQETGELKTYDQVRSGSIQAAIELMGKSEEEATNMADKMLPKLPRWKNLEK